MEIKIINTEKELIEFTTFLTNVFLLKDIEVISNFIYFKELKLKEIEINDNLKIVFSKSFFSEKIKERKFKYTIEKLLNRFFIDIYIKDEDKIELLGIFYKYNERFNNSKQKNDEDVIDIYKCFINKLAENLSYFTKTEENYKKIKLLLSKDKNLDKRKIIISEFKYAFKPIFIRNIERYGFPFKMNLEQKISFLKIVFSRLDNLKFKEIYSLLKNNISDLKKEKEYINSFESFLIKKIDETKQSMPFVEMTEEEIKIKNKNVLNRYFKSLKKELFLTAEELYELGDEDFFIAKDNKEFLNKKILEKRSEINFIGNNQIPMLQTGVFEDELYIYGSMILRDNDKIDINNKYNILALLLNLKEKRLVHIFFNTYQEINIEFKELMKKIENKNKMFLLTTEELLNFYKDKNEFMLDFKDNIIYMQKLFLSSNNKDDTYEKNLLEIFIQEILLNHNFMNYIIEKELIEEFKLLFYQEINICSDKELKRGKKTNFYNLNNYIDRLFYQEKINTFFDKKLNNLFKNEKYLLLLVDLKTISCKETMYYFENKYETKIEINKSEILKLEEEERGVKEIVDFQTFDNLKYNLTNNNLFINNKKFHDLIKNDNNFFDLWDFIEKDENIIDVKILNIKNKINLNF